MGLIRAILAEAAHAIEEASNSQPNNQSTGNQPQRPIGGFRSPQPGYDYTTNQRDLRQQQWQSPCNCQPGQYCAHCRYGIVSPLYTSRRERHHERRAMRHARRDMLFGSGGLFSDPMRADGRLPAVPVGTPNAVRATAPAPAAGYASYGQSQPQQQPQQRPQPPVVQRQQPPIAQRQRTPVAPRENQRNQGAAARELQDEYYDPPPPYEAAPVIPAEESKR